MVTIEFIVKLFTGKNHFVAVYYDYEIARVAYPVVDFFRKQKQKLSTITPKSVRA